MSYKFCSFFAGMFFFTLVDIIGRIGHLMNLAKYKVKRLDWFFPHAEKLIWCVSAPGLWLTLCVGTSTRYSEPGAVCAGAYYPIQGREGRAVLDECFQDGCQGLMIFTGISMQIVIIFYWIGTLTAVILFITIPWLTHR